MNPEQVSRALRLLAEEAGHPALSQSLEDLERRARDGRFYVAVVGQFKRGKSTLINALLGERLLPTGVPPVTSVISLLRGGGAPRVTVHFRHVPSVEVPVGALADYVSETGNPGNLRSVAAVEIEWPLRLLESGLCLVDTPGVGSVFETNTRATHGFIPHVDAALVVLGVDPPISAPEMDLLRALLVERPPLIVVVNKADLPSPADLEAGVAFTRRVLRDAPGHNPLLLVVSARLALEQRPLADGRADGALADLRAALEALARSAGADLAQAALARGAARARKALLHALELERRALTEPAETLARLEGALATQAARIEGFLGDFRYELQGELDRFTQQLLQRRDQFIAMAGAAAADLAGAAVAATDPGAGVEWEREVTAAAWARLLEKMRAWEGELLPWVDARQHALAERFTSDAAALLATVRAQAADLAGPAALEAPAPRFAPTAQYYLDAGSDVPAMDLSGVTDRLLHAVLPAALRRERVERRVAGRVETWARHNATRIASAIAMAADDSRRSFAYELDRSVQDVALLAHTALGRARQRRTEGERGAEAALRRLDDLLHRCRTTGEPGRNPLAPAQAPAS